MHVHTIYSPCSINPIKMLKKICNKKGIIPVIADHNYLTKLDFGIMGEEIATNRGEFIGLFLNEQVNNKDIFEAIDSVKEQGGLIYLPHPFDSRRRRSLCRYNILNDKEFIKNVDIVEVFNSRCITNEPNTMAFEYAKRHNLLMGVGSDAHFPWEIGNAYIDGLNMLDTENPKSLLNYLKKNNGNLKYYGKLGHPINIQRLSKLSKKLRDWNIIKRGKNFNKS